MFSLSGRMMQKEALHLSARTATTSDARRREEDLGETHDLFVPERHFHSIHPIPLSGAWRAVAPTSSGQSAIVAGMSTKIHIAKP